MATEGTVVRQGQMKDVGESCRIRAGSPSLPERGPRCRGRAENSTAEGGRETEHINNRAKISLFSSYSLTFASNILTSSHKMLLPESFSSVVRQRRDLEHVLEHGLKNREEFM